MIAFAFALPQESRDLERRLVDAEPFGAPPLRGRKGQLAGRSVAVVHTGVGAELAASRAATFLESAQPQLLIGSGFAGGLDPALQLGELVVGTNVSTPDWVARCRTLFADDARVHFGPIVGAHLPIESVAEKAEFARVSRGMAVDMESAALVAAAASAGVPFLAVRAISDAAEVALPVPFSEWFDLAGQRPRVAALLRFLATHPTQIGPFARFVGGLKPARRALTNCLLRLVAASDA